MIATTQEEIKALRAAGKILAGVLDDLIKLSKAGISTAELDLAAEHAMRARGAEPAFLHYQPEGAVYPFPAALCVAINKEAVHGVPSEKRFLLNGDVLSLDTGLSYQGYFVDAARTIIVGSHTDFSRKGGDVSLKAAEGDPKAQQLVVATHEALEAALAAVRPGAHLGDIGAAVTRTARKYGFTVVSELGGHGIGKSAHEQPHIANDSKEGTGIELKEGMVLAIEPILTEGKDGIITEDDEWTISMADGKRAAHFEDTIIVTKDGVEVLTRL